MENFPCIGNTHKKNAKCNVGAFLFVLPRQPRSVHCAHSLHSLPIAVVLIAQKKKHTKTCAHTAYKYNKSCMTKISALTTFWVLLLPCYRATRVLRAAPPRELKNTRKYSAKKNPVQLEGMTDLYGEMVLI